MFFQDALYLFGLMNIQSEQSCNLENKKPNFSFHFYNILDLFIIPILRFCFDGFTIILKCRKW